jgi:hypothetical protein
MSKFIDLTGKRFGRWLVLERTPNVRPGTSRWKCLCECGKIKDHVLFTSLVRGSSMSCGCLRSDMLMKPDNECHSQRNPTWRVWQSMRTRCRNANHPSYKGYGARGIGCCDEWFNSYDAFFADMGTKPEDGSLDRIDNEKGYCKENCRWATKTQQAGNTRRNIKVSWKGWICNLIDVARAENVDYMTLHVAFKRGDNLEGAVTAIKAKGKLFHERAETLGGSRTPKTSLRRRSNKPQNLPKIDRRYKHFGGEAGEDTKIIPNHMIPDMDRVRTDLSAEDRAKEYKARFEKWKEIEANNNKANKARWKNHAACMKLGITYRGPLPTDWNYSIHSRTPSTQPAPTN